MNPNLVATTIAVLIASNLCAQAPKVIKLEPANGSARVDAKKVTKLVVTFDQDMSRRGFSFCGGGPKFPKAKRARWKNKRTIVMEVELEPDNDYSLSLNCPAAQNFRSVKGVSLVPTPWRFSTLPASLLPKKLQTKRNRAAFAELKNVLASKYSYYDYRALDWKKLYKKHENAILSSPTELAWASAVGSMLKPVNDIHMYLRSGKNTIGSASRRIDSLFRKQLLGKYFVQVEQAGHGIISARTQDGIEYLLISGWNRKVDFDKVDQILAGLAGSADKKRYQGRVTVLMSRYCMSSCEAFLLMMKQAEQSTLIGQRSYGSSGNPKGHKLKNGVEIVLPSWKALRPDGTCFEGNGIVPDIKVTATDKDLKKRDPILEKALEHLRKD